MAITYATVTGRITLPSSDIGIEGTLTAVPMVESAAGVPAVLVFPAAGADRVTIGEAAATVDVDGYIATPFLKIPLGSSINGVADGTPVYWRLDFETKNKYPGVPARWTLGYFIITASTTLDTLMADQVGTLVVNPASLTSLEDLLADATAAAAAAAGSASSASTSATSASTSATAAASSATTAGLARDQSITYRDLAAAARDAAVTARDVAGTHETNAKGYRDNAATARDAAAASATSSATSATASQVSRLASEAARDEAVDISGITVADSAVTYGVQYGGAADLIVSSQSRLKDAPALGLYFPEAHGALGGGAADATAVAATFTAAAAGGGSVYLGQVFSLEAAVQIPVQLGRIWSSSPLVGGFRAHSTKPLTSSLLFTPSGSAPVRGVTNCVIENITLDGASLAPQRWLQTSGGATVTDPQADYYDAALRPAAKIGNPAYAAATTAVAASQTLGSAGNLTLSASPVQVTPVRKVTITGGASSNTGRSFTVTGTDLAGSTITSTIATGPAAGATVTTSIVFRTVTQIAVNGALTGNVTAGTAAYDIFGVVAEGRRNPNYVNNTGMLKLTVCENVTVRGCRFINHYGQGITEAGGKDILIENNTFDNVGKSDGPYMAVWTQSFGSPTANPALPYFTNSENIKVQGNKFTNLERMAVLFAPTLGGRCTDNIIENVREGGIFVPVNGAINGGRIVIERNKIKTVRIADIVANGIELNNVSDLTIRNNVVEDCDRWAVTPEGCQRVLIEGNTFRNCYNTHTVPYGPFSERYAFNIGDPAIAGQVRSVVDGSYITIGTQSGIGSKGVRIKNNIFNETRGSYPSLFQQVKNGGNNLGGETNVENNTFDVPVGMRLLDDTIGSVWQSTTSLQFRENSGQTNVSAWQPLTAVAVGAVVQSPGGSWIKSPTARTTRATFDATEQGLWATVSGTTGTIEKLYLDATYARQGSQGRTDLGLGTAALAGSASSTAQGIVELATTAEATTGTDTVRAVTPAGLKAAIDALVNGSPAALDTLKELSDALGADANYAATTAALIATKQRADAYTAVTGAYTVLATDGVISADATGAAFSVTLPTAVGITGRTYQIRKADATANVVSVATTASQTIGTVAAPWTLGQRRQSVTVQSDGANWVVLRSKSDAYIRKSSDTARASTTVTAADPELLLPVQANAVYEIHVVLLFTGAATGDIKYQLTLPASSTAEGYWVGAGTTIAAAAIAGSVGLVAGDLTAVRSSGASDTSTTIGITMQGFVTIGATSGNLGLKWSQLTSDVTATTVLTGSHMTLTRRDAG